MMTRMLREQRETVSILGGELMETPTHSYKLLLPLDTIATTPKSKRSGLSRKSNG